VRGWRVIPAVVHVKLCKKLNLAVLASKENVMKARTILLVIALVVVGMFSCSAKAGELDDLLKGKMTEYVGTCRFDKNDMLIFESQEDMKVVKCVVGTEPPDSDTKFVLLFLNEEPTVLLEYSMPHRAQRVLWKRGST
jgi:hypothetical protein